METRSSRHSTEQVISDCMTVLAALAKYRSISLAVLMDRLGIYCPVHV